MTKKEDAQAIEEDQEHRDDETERDEAGVATGDEPEIEEAPEGEGEEQDPQDSDADDHEVVLDGGDSQPHGKKRKTWQDRVNRINQKVDAEKGRADTAEARAKRAEEETELLKSQIREATQPQAPAKPKPDDFDEGVYDPGFIEQQDLYDEYRIDKKVEEKLSKVIKRQTTNTSVEAKSANLDRKAREHYQRADKLKSSDFGDTEDKAIEIMGGDVVKDIIENLPNSERLVYYLGKNPDVAAVVAAQMKSNPAQAVFRLGEIGAKLKVRPKSKVAPDPDDELPGGGSPRKQPLGPPGATYE